MPAFAFNVERCCEHAAASRKMHVSCLRIVCRLHNTYHSYSHRSRVFEILIVPHSCQSLPLRHCIKRRFSGETDIIFSEIKATFFGHVIIPSGRHPGDLKLIQSMHSSRIAYFSGSVASPLPTSFSLSICYTRKDLFSMPQSKAKMEKTSSSNESTPRLTRMRSGSLPV